MHLSSYLGPAQPALHMTHVSVHKLGTNPCVYQSRFICIPAPVQVFLSIHLHIAWQKFACITAAELPRCPAMDLSTTASTHSRTVLHLTMCSGALKSLLHRLDGC